MLVRGYRAIHIYIYMYIYVYIYTLYLYDSSFDHGSDQTTAWSVKTNVSNAVAMLPTSAQPS